VVHAATKHQQQSGSGGRQMGLHLQDPAQANPAALISRSSRAGRLLLPSRRTTTSGTTRACQQGATMRQQQPRVMVGAAVGAASRSGRSSGGCGGSWRRWRRL
jgi:hypothetical protein